MKNSIFTLVLSIIISMATVTQANDSLKSEQSKQIDLEQILWMIETMVEFNRLHFRPLQINDAHFLAYGSGIREDNQTFACVAVLLPNQNFQIYLSYALTKKIRILFLNIVPLAIGNVKMMISD